MDVDEGETGIEDTTHSIFTTGHTHACSQATYLCSTPSGRYAQ